VVMREINGSKSIIRELISHRRLYGKGVKVIREYTNEGKPFVLYLRKFDIDVLHGQNPIDRHLTDNYIMSNLPQGVNLITILDASELTDVKGTPTARLAPSLSLPHTAWKSVVDVLIKEADMIVSECHMLTEGVTYELKSCLRHDKEDQTVLILPPPNSFLKTIDDEELVQMFPRCIWANEFHKKNLFDSFVIADLLERIKKIGRLSKEKRMRLLNNVDRLSRYPITYRGVVEGYMNNALMAELSDLNDEDEEGWHYRFWSYFRASSILGLQLLRQQVTLREIIIDLVDCFLKMTYLMLWSKEDQGIIVVRGDLEFARKCAISAYNLALKDKVASSVYLKIASKLLSEIDQLEGIIATNTDRVIVRSPIKQIVTMGTSIEQLDKAQTPKDSRAAPHKEPRRFRGKNSGLE
jgi:hypothetical protein